VRTHLATGVPLAFFDPVLVEQVVINLIENAVRYAGRRPLSRLPRAPNATRSSSRSPTAGRASRPAQRKRSSRGFTAFRAGRSATGESVSA